MFCTRERKRMTASAVAVDAKAVHAIAWHEYSNAVARTTMDPSDNLVLLIEDCAETRELYEHVLRGAGYVVATAADGRDGVSMAHAQRPDVIITDLDMPGMDGLE